MLAACWSMVVSYVVVSNKEKLTLHGFVFEGGKEKDTNVKKGNLFFCVFLAGVFLFRSPGRESVHLFGSHS